MRRSRLLELGTYDHLLGAIVLFAVFLTCGLSPMQTDTWWQLRAGRDMWAARQVLLTDVYSHTAYGSVWSNHEWLAEAIFYGFYAAGGLAFLTIFSAVLISAGWMFSWRMSRAGGAAVFALTVLALIPSANWWEPRPHAFSLLFIPWMVWLFHRGQQRWLPVMFLVWANCHGGVLLGLVLLGACLTVQVFVRRAGPVRSVLLLLSCVLAMTATPLGLDFWVEIPRSLSRINQYTLDEWVRPSLTELTQLPFWGIAAVYLVSLARNLRRVRQMTAGELSLHACALVLLPGAASAVRHVGPFLMVAAPALTHVWSVKPEPPDPDEKPAVNLTVMVAAAVLIAVILSTAYRRELPRLKWTPVTEAAITALQACPDNLYNRYDEGGMLLWFAPDRKVFLDGRQDPFPPALVLEHIEMETGKRDYRATFERHSIQCAFLPVISPVASQLERDNWTELHRDAEWVIFRK